MSIYDEIYQRNLAKLEKSKTDAEKEIEANKALYSADITKKKSKTMENALINQGNIGYQGAVAQKVQKVNDLYGGLGGSGAMGYNQNVIQNKVNANLQANQKATQENLTELSDAEKAKMAELDAQKVATQEKYNNSVSDMQFEKYINEKQQAEADAKALAQQQNSRNNDIVQLIMKQAKMPKTDSSGQIITDTNGNPVLGNEIDVNKYNELLTKAKNYYGLTDSDITSIQEQVKLNTGNYGIRTNELASPVVTKAKQELDSVLSTNPNKANETNSRLTTFNKYATTLQTRAERQALADSLGVSGVLNLRDNLIANELQKMDDKSKAIYLFSQYKTGAIDKETADYLAEQFKIG